MTEKEKEEWKIDAVAQELMYSIIDQLSIRPEYRVDQERGMLLKQQSPAARKVLKREAKYILKIIKEIEAT